MAITEFDICSRALLLLGKGTISSFGSEEGDVGTICGNIYPEFSKYLIAIYPWRFSIKKVQLAELTTAPLNEWRNAHQLPPDALNIRAMRTSDNTGQVLSKQYEIFEDQVHSNEIEMWADYQFFPEEVKWPAYFQQFAINALAAELAMAITDKIEFRREFTQIAFGPPADNGRGGLFGQAKTVDAQQQPPQELTSFSLLTARFAGVSNTSTR